MKRITLLAFVSCVSFISCTQTSDAFADKNSNLCFCDSVYNNFKTDTLEEYLCYKNEKVYKLRIADNRTIISRHALGNNRWLYESMATTSDNNLLINEYQFFISVTERNDSAELKYVSTETDSLRVILERNSDTVFSKSYRTNKAIIPRQFLADSSNILTVLGYSHDSLPLPNTKVLGLVTKSRSISYRTNYLLNNSLDKVLIKFKRCVADEHIE